MKTGDFEKFAKGRVSSLVVNDYMKGVNNSLTPYIIEERPMNIAQLDVFSRLLMDRIIWIGFGIDDQSSMVTQAQMLFLDSIGDEDITMYINTPGGSISSGLGIIDTMDFIKSNVNTINMGIAASMGAVLLASGRHRRSLKNSRVMIHESSSGFQGTFSDAKANFDEWTKVNNKVFEMLAIYTKKSPEQIKKDANRDLWFSAEEAMEYGLIDSIITKK